MRGLAAFALALLAAIPVAGPASAQIAPRLTDAPIDITGDRLEVEGDVATWSGAVRAVQGEAILSADTLVADMTEGGDVSRIQASGQVRYSNGKQAITGKRGVYDAAARTITMIEDVVVVEGEQVMVGGELVYWIDSGRILFTAPAGRRIRGIFHTKRDGAAS
jgi:lipopolysaccharide export system protein LptA